MWFEHAYADVSLMRACTDVYIGSSLVALESDQRDDNYIPHSSSYQILPEIGQALEVKTTIPASMLMLMYVTGERVCMHVLCPGSFI